MRAVLGSARAKPSFRARAWFWLALSTVPRSVGAEPLSCNDAYVATQRLRNAGQLRAARDSALACGQNACSPTVLRDCVRWLDEIERATPSIVVHATDGAGRELAEVSVEAAGELLAERLDGRAIAVDPGDTVFRFSFEEMQAEQRVIIGEGEKYRVLQVTFAATPSAPAPSPPAASEPDTMPVVSSMNQKSPPSRAREEPARRSSSKAEPPPNGKSGPPAGAYVAGAFGAAALSTFGALALSGYLSERHLRDTCGRTRSCDHDDVESVRTRYRVADVALGVGAVSLGAAALIWALARSSSSIGALGQSSLRGRPMLLLDVGAAHTSASFSGVGWQGVFR